MRQITRLSGKIGWHLTALGAVLCTTCLNAQHRGDAPYDANRNHEWYADRGTSPVRHGSVNAQRSAVAPSTVDAQRRGSVSGIGYQPADSVGARHTAADVIATATQYLQDESRSEASVAPRSTVTGRKHHGPEPDASKGSPKAGDSLLYGGPKFPEPVDFRSLVVRLVLGTSLVLALCASSVWIGKRWFGLGAPSASQNSRLSLVETLTLGHRCYIQLVQVDGQNFVLGRDAAGIKAIVPYPEAFESELARIEENQTVRKNTSGVYPPAPRETEHIVNRRSWT